MSPNRAVKARHQFRRRFSLQPSFFKEDAEEEEGNLHSNSRSTSRVDEESESCAGSSARHKVVVMGAAKVGKSSLIGRFLYGSFSPKYKRTVEEMHHLALSSLTLDILDTSGAYEFPAMRALSISSADAFVLVYDVTDASSFDELRVLRDQILETKKTAVPIVVVGNKLDLATEEGKRAVDRDATESLVCVDWEHGFVEASAKDDVNVAQVFKELLSQANVKLSLSPALRRRRRQSLARHSISVDQATSEDLPSTQQLQQLQELQERHGKRNSCSIS